LNKYQIFEGFTQSVFFADSVPLPRFLLEHYHSMGMTNEELVLVLHLLAASAKIDVAELAYRMGLREDDVEGLLAQLQKKRILSVYENQAKTQSFGLQHYDLSGLMDQLFEIWGIMSYRQMHSAAADDGLAGDNEAAAESEDQAMAQLKLSFEQELGRALTHMECDHIRQWVLAGWSSELITLALRRGVSAGVRTFRYLDSILREWEKKGLRTVDEVLEDERYFQNKRSKSRKGEKVSTDKMVALRKEYDDVYL